MFPVYSPNLTDRMPARFIPQNFSVEKQSNACEFVETEDP
jgi:hypothetical protein